MDITVIDAETAREKANFAISKQNAELKVDTNNLLCRINKVIEESCLLGLKYVHIKPELCLIDRPLFKKGFSKFYTTPLCDSVDQKLKELGYETEINPDLLSFTIKW
jgi:hypothetical protein